MIRAKELAEEANRLKDEYISTEHIFLAISAERNTASARLLAENTLRFQAASSLLRARIGAVHSVVFGGFSPDALAGRLRQARAAPGHRGNLARAELLLGAQRQQVLLLRRHQLGRVERGQVVAKPGSITPHTKFMSEVYVLRKEEGGRHKAFFTGYRPQFYIRTMDVTGNIKLPEGVEMVMPGDNVNLEVELIVPVALEQGSKFAIREGGLTVGAGVITKIIS